MYVSPFTLVMPLPPAYLTVMCRQLCLTSYFT